MRVKLLASPGGTSGQNQYLISYLINESVAIDAGSLGFLCDAAQQAAVGHVLLSHSHIDHVASLPIFLENTTHTVSVYGNDAVLECLRSDVFNDRYWPDVLSNGCSKPPRVRLERLEERKPVDIDGLKVTPVPVDHVVPTFGFIVEEANSAVVIPSDTGPTSEIWEAANGIDHLKAVFLEATFPDSMDWLAEVSKHLTPAKFAKELAKLKQSVKKIAVHVKARFYPQVIRELEALELPCLEIGTPGKEYSF